MNEFDVFYNVWLKNHRDDNLALIKYYAKYERYAYLSPKDCHEVCKIQNKYGEHVMTLIIPYIKDRAHRINESGTYTRDTPPTLIFNTNVYNLTDDKMPKY